MNETRQQWQERRCAEIARARYRIRTDQVMDGKERTYALAYLENEQSMDTLDFAWSDHRLGYSVPEGDELLEGIARDYGNRRGA